MIPSPYLARNQGKLIDWYDWSKPAFDKAKMDDKLIFLVLGTFSCHLCHEAERLNFSDSTLALNLNQNYVSVLCDKDLHPEVSRLYNLFARGLVAGRVMAPVYLILTPDLMPVYAASNAELTQHGTHPGLYEIIHLLHAQWKGKERKILVENSRKFLESIQDQLKKEVPSYSDQHVLDLALDMLYQTMDPVHGGLIQQPKYPLPTVIDFAITSYHRTRDQRALFYADRTIDKILRGGIWDYLDGGLFHYSLDQRWGRSAFEKTLTDNALFADSLLKTWQVSRKMRHQTAAQECASYIVSQLQDHDAGGYYTSQDSEVAETEGLTYTWTVDEVAQVLGKEAAKLFGNFYQIRPQAASQDRSVIHQPYTIEEYAKEHHLNPESLEQDLLESIDKMRTARQMRKAPQVDGKMLASANGLAMAALIRVGSAFEQEELVKSATRAMRYAKKNFIQDGKVWHSTGVKSTLRDYASLIHAALNFFECAQGADYLQLAVQLANTAATLFYDESGTFYTTELNAPHILLRLSEFEDAEEIGSTALHAQNLVRLAHITQDASYMTYARGIFKASQATVLASPNACSTLLNALYLFAKTPLRIVVALHKKAPAGLLEQVRSQLLGTTNGRATLIWKQDEALNDVPDLNAYTSEGKIAIYILRGKELKEKITELKKLGPALEKAL